MAIKAKAEISLVRVNDGSDGIGIKSSAVSYQAGTSGTTIPTGSWSITIPSVAAGQYLWTKTVITYTDGKSTTSYSVGRMGQNGSAGADGKPGTDGVGVKSTSVKYQASASQTVAPTGTWVDAVPKLSAATPYLWTRTVITYTDDKTSTSYSVSSTLDGVEIGSRNYVRNSNIFTGSVNGLTVEVNGYDIRIHGTNTNTTNAYGIGAWLRPSNIASPGEVWSLSTTHPLPTGLYLQVNSVDATGTSIYANINLKGDGERTTTSGRIPDSSTGLLNGFFGVLSTVRDVDVTFRIKFEKGNKATDWTPAPEDIQSDIDDAMDSATDANNKIDTQTPIIEEATASIEILQDSIASLVTDENGGSLMEQTADGWTFNIGSIQEAISKATEEIEATDDRLGTVEQLADRTSQLANDISEKTAYINMTTDESGGPVMELGKSDSPFKVRITNTSIDFMQGSQKIAYITNNQLYIQSSVVTDELMIGDGTGWIWKRRSNGNMGLRFI